jgi:hypothetical protein
MTIGMPMPIGIRKMPQRRRIEARAFSIAVSAFQWERTPVEKHGHAATGQPHDRRRFARNVAVYLRDRR